MSVSINLGIKVRCLGRIYEKDNISLEDLKYNLLIYGKTETKRREVLSYIANQLHEKTPDLGVLIIRLLSNEDQHLFYIDRQYSYGDSDLSIPYFLENKLNRQIRSQFSRYFSGIFGFHFEIYWVMVNMIKQYRAGEFPSSIVDFLEDLKNYLEKNPYGEKFTKSNLDRMDKAINLFQENPRLESTVWIPLEVPEWLRLWQEGKTVCIDLSGCDLSQQKIILPFLLQAINDYMPIVNSEVPRGVVILDEVDKVFRRVPYENYAEHYKKNKEHWSRLRESHLFLTIEQMEQAYGDKNYLFEVQLDEMYKDLIANEFHFRNIACITSCKDPIEIYDSINAYSQIKLNLE